MKYFKIVLFFLSMIMCRSSIHLHSDILDNSSCILDNRSCGERPDLNFNIASPSGHFIIHYNNYHDDIDDFAYNVGIAADSSRNVIVDIMGFLPEIDDNDGLYDIYIEPLSNGQYGWNCLDIDGSGSSWIKIDDDYQGSSYTTTGEDAMRITIAHEFFHAVQRAYLPSSSYNDFFFELSSMWIEDIIYPDINDYISFSQLADYYFEDPERDIEDYKGYGLGLYGHYLNYRFGDQIIQRIWSDLSNIDTNIDDYIINSINSVLSDNTYGYNSSFTDTWADFNARNLFNGQFNSMNNDIYYYIDQNQFNPISSNPSSMQETNNINFNLNNKSVSIESFNISSLLFFNLLNTPNYNSEVYGLTSIISNDSYIDTLYHTYQSDILNISDIVHIIYMSKNSDITFESEILSNFLSLNTDDDILIYPNPIFTGNNLIVRLNQGLEVNNLIISLYNIQGHFLNKFYVGDINPTLDNFNEFSLSIFNQYDSSGIYILSFDMDGKTQTKKIIYLK